MSIAIPKSQYDMMTKTQREAVALVIGASDTAGFRNNLRDLPVMRDGVTIGEVALAYLDHVRALITNNGPTADQLLSLRRYAGVNGRTWKARLQRDWEIGRIKGSLRDVRDQFGPAWLTKFKLPAKV